LVKETAFAIHTRGGEVKAHVLRPDGSRVAVAMGQVRFASEAIPMTGPPREVLGEILTLAEGSYTINAATVGNPHCVILVDAPSEELARRLGPEIERHPSFPDRTNVQFMKPLDAHRIRIEIWERGAGYTQASGTSSCAAAAVACRLGLCRSPVTVEMPGGTLEIRLDGSFRAEMEGDVASVGCGCFSEEFLAVLGLRRR
jgi:diaminopimelate epimerase